MNAIKAEYTLWWISEDKQGSFNMGDFPTREAAEAAIPSAKTQLLDQCGNDEDRAGIEAGIFSVDDPK